MGKKSTLRSGFNINFPLDKGHAGVYSFGFNGMEKIDEISGNGNDLDFGARVYDSRLGRFLSIDPLTSSFADFSPYIFAGDIPIRLIDNKGEGPIDPRTWERKSSLILISTDDYNVFAVYPKSSAPTAKDQALFNAALAKGYLLGSDASIFNVFIESFLGSERPKLEFKDPFENRNREKDPRASSTYQVGGQYSVMAAAKSGNYDYSERVGDDKFRITSVTDGIITQINNYSSGWGDKLVLSSSTKFDIEYYSETKTEFVDGKQYDITRNFAKVLETTTYANGTSESKSYTNIISQTAKPTSPTNE